MNRITIKQSISVTVPWASRGVVVALARNLAKLALKSGPAYQTDKKRRPDTVNLADPTAMALIPYGSLAPVSLVEFGAIPSSFDPLNPVDNDISDPKNHIAMPFDFQDPVIGLNITLGSYSANGNTTYPVDEAPVYAIPCLATPCGQLSKEIVFPSIHGTRLPGLPSTPNKVQGSGAAVSGSAQPYSPIEVSNPMNLGSFPSFSELMASLSGPHMLTPSQMVDFRINLYYSFALLPSCVPSPSTWVAVKMLLNARNYSVSPTPLNLVFANNSIVPSEVSPAYNISRLSTIRRKPNGTLFINWSKMESQIRDFGLFYEVYDGGIDPTFLVISPVDPYSAPYNVDGRPNPSHDPGLAFRVYQDVSVIAGNNTNNVLFT